MNPVLDGTIQFLSKTQGVLCFVLVLHSSLYDFCIADSILGKLSKVSTKLLISQQLKLNL